MKIIPCPLLTQNEDSKKILPVALISLKDQVERRKILENRKIPTLWIQNYFQGVDLRGLNHKELKDIAELDEMRNFYGREINSGEIGCALSHREANNWLANSNFDLMLILEDDIIPNIPFFEAEIERIANIFYSAAQNKVAFIVHFGLKKHHVQNALKRKVYSLSNFKNKKESTAFMHCEPGKRTLWYTHAYLISKAAAINTIKFEPKIKILADDWGARYNLGVLDSIFYCQPQIFNQDELIPSTIGVRFNDSNDIEQESKIKSRPLSLRIYDTIKDGSFLSKLYARGKSIFPVLVN